MSIRVNLRGGGAARADGPDRFVRNQNTGEFFRGQRAGAAVELAAENCFGQAGVAVLLRFSQADDGGEVCFQCHQGLLGSVVVRLSEELPAFRLAYTYLTATRVV